MSRYDARHHHTPRAVAPHRSTRITVRGLAGAGAAVLALTLAGCGDEPAPGDEPTVTVTESPTTPAETTAGTSSPTGGGTGGDTGTAGTGRLPQGAGPYADGLVIAWGSGNRAEALRYATPEVVSALFGEHSAGGPHWDQVDVEGAAGTIYVTYQDTETGEKLSLGVLNEAASKATEHSVTRATFEG